MIDIYNEEKYVKILLEYGISQKWTRDIRLLTRYYKNPKCGEDLKLNQVIERILKKLENASNRKNNRLKGYLPNSKNEDYAISVIKEEWKRGEPLRKIDKIEISKEVVDWFIGLEDNYKASKEFVEEEKKGFDHLGVHISIKEKIMTWNRIKFLFTMYVWSMIQNEYNPGGYLKHNIEKYSGRFKEDAGLNSGFKFEDEMNLLHDLGLIRISNNSEYVTVEFINQFDVFGVPVTDENRVILTGIDAGTGDLYFPGYWLEKQKMGSFVCQRCGCEFAHYGKGRAENARKYCRECAKKNKNKITNNINKTTRVCEDCGAVYAINIYDHSSTRCVDCQKNKLKNDTRIRMKKFRIKQKTGENIIVV